MAGKISEYPSKTVFNDTDLYDCSTGGTTSEKVTYSDLKDDLKNTFVHSDPTGTALQMDSSIQSLIDVDATFISDTDRTLSGTTAMNYYWYKYGKTLQIWMTGTIAFTSGATTAEFRIEMPTVGQSPTFVGTMPNFHPVADAGIWSGATSGVGVVGSFQYITIDGGVTQQTDLQGTCFIVSGSGAAPKLSLNLPDIVSNADKIRIGVNLTTPIE